MGRKSSPRSPQAEGGSRAASPPPPSSSPPSSPLWALPEELLLLICSYLDVQALGRLGQVCRRLRFLSSRDLLWKRIARGCLNSGFTQLGTDLAPGIPVKERVKVSQNWRHGRCRRETVLKWKCNLMPWMELDGQYLYLSQAENIQAYQLCPDGTGLQRHPQAIFSGHQEDVCRFVLVNSHIVSGGGDGNIVLHKIHGSYSVKFSAHEQEVNCVDFQGGFIVSGSRDRTAKVWSLSAGRVGQCLHTVQTEDRVWSIAISPLLSSFVTGTACCGHTSPLRIWDFESGQLLTCLGTDFHHGAGVLDVFYETPSLLLSCGYDTYIRYWDIRTSTRKCVREWEEPHDSALYCIRTDGNHMIASGSSYYGVVRLWDKRQTQCLQQLQLNVSPGERGTAGPMEPRGIVKAFPKRKKVRDDSGKSVPPKIPKEGMEEPEEWLKPVAAYVLQAGIGQARAEIFHKQIVQNGGCVHNRLCSEVTHVIVAEDMDCDRAFRLLKLAKLPSRLQLVKASWLSDCIRDQKLLNTTGYSVFIPRRYREEGEQQQQLLGSEEIRSSTEESTAEPNAKAQLGDSSQQNLDSLAQHQPSESSGRISCDLHRGVEGTGTECERGAYTDTSSTKVYDDEDSEGEDASVTQGDLEALISGHYPVKLSEETSDSSSAVAQPASKWVCAQSSNSKKENHNQCITEKLEVLAKAYSVQGDKWRALGYAKAINALKSYHKPVTSYQEACKIPGIGKRMAEKILEILESGHLRKLDHISESVPVLELFSNIWGAGVKTAQMWYQQGFRTLDDIRTKASLTSQQAVGLKHYEDFLERMPREEAAEIEQTVRQAALALKPGLVCVACGSYRRGKATCGDVDVLVTHPDGQSHRGLFSKLLDSLHESGFLTDDLVSQEDNGDQKKYLGVCRLPGPARRHRRLDIIVVPYSEFACALLYFTGSAHFNRSMRALAKTKGMSLSEHALSMAVVRGPGGVKVASGHALPTPTERDVFIQLGLPYREPSERDW